MPRKVDNSLNEWEHNHTHDLIYNCLYREKKKLICVNNSEIRYKLGAEKNVDANADLNFNALFQQVLFHMDLQQHSHL